jgi:hypothetical protein
MAAASRERLRRHAPFIIELRSQPAQTDSNEVASFGGGVGGDRGAGEVSADHPDHDPQRTHQTTATARRPG